MVSLTFLYQDFTTICYIYFMSKEKNYHIIGGDPSCDDCEICKAMAKAEKEGRELSMKELVDLMEKQNYLNFVEKKGYYEN